MDAGDTLSLTCAATKNFFPFITTLDMEWFDPIGTRITGGGGILITGGTSTTNFTLNSTLIFFSISTSQAGLYTCRVNLTIPESGLILHSVNRVSHVRVRSE